MKKTTEGAVGTIIQLPIHTEGPMKAPRFIGDAMTVVSTNIIFNIVTITAYFYTDILGLAAGTVGTIVLLSKLADAFTDIGMGLLVDRTSSKYGKARPWLIRMALPSFICIVLLFTIPAGSGTGVIIVYATITNLLVLSGVYTAISIPAGSLLSFETKNPHERAKMGIGRLVFAYAAGTSVTALMIPAANRLGGDQRAWIIMSVIYGAISAISLIISFLFVRENNNTEHQQQRKISLLTGISLLFRNKYWVITLAVNLLIQFIYAVGVAETYYMKYVFGNENLVATTGFFRLIAVTVGFVLSGLYVKRLGKRNLVLIGMVVAIAGCIPRLFNPYGFALGLASIGITTLGGVPVLAVIGAMVADTIEYGEWKTGMRTVGLASSSHSFAGKLGSAVFVGASGWLLSLSKYDGMLPVQPHTAIRMITILNIHVPLICYILIFVLMLFYRLDKDYEQIIADLEEGRAR